MCVSFFRQRNVDLNMKNDLVFNHYHSPIADRRLASALPSLVMRMRVRRLLLCLFLAPSSTTACSTEQRRRRNSFSVFTFTVRKLLRAERVAPAPGPIFPSLWHNLPLWCRQTAKLVQFSCSLNSKVISAALPLCFLLRD